MNNYVQKGHTLTVTAPYALTSGGGCQIGNTFGVSVNNQNTGDSSEIVVEGVFDLAKDASAFISGAKVYWDNSQYLATANTTTAAGAPNKEIGVAVLDQANGTPAPGGATGDATVRVRLNPTSFAVVSSADLDPSVLQKAVITLTAAQILAMYATPQSVLPAPPAGQAIVVDQVLIEVKPGGTAFAGGGTVTVQYTGGSTVHSSTLPAATVNSASQSLSQMPPPTTVVAAPAATGLTITNGTGAFTTGNGTLVVTIFYSVVTL